MKMSRDAIEYTAAVMEYREAKDVMAFLNTINTLWTMNPKNPFIQEFTFALLEAMRESETDALVVDGKPVRKELADLVLEIASHFGIGYERELRQQRYLRTKGAGHESSKEIDSLHGQELGGMEIEGVRNEGKVFHHPKE
jgi:hypothetical protein